MDETAFVAARTIPIIGVIDDKMVKLVRWYLSLLVEAEIVSEIGFHNKETEMCFDPIHVAISSEGGDAYCGMAIHDMLAEVRCMGFPLITHGYGQVSSAGVIILAAGVKGWRIVTENTLVSLHDVQTKFDEEIDIQTVNNTLEDIKMLSDSYLTMLSLYTGKKPVEIMEAYSESITLKGQQIADWGIADTVRDFYWQTDKGEKICKKGKRGRKKKSKKTAKAKKAKKK